MHVEPTFTLVALHAVACATVGNAHWHVNVAGLIVAGTLHASNIADKTTNGDAHAGVHEPTKTVAPSPQFISPDTVGSVHSGSHVNVADAPLVVHVIAEGDDGR